VLIKAVEGLGRKLIIETVKLKESGRLM